MDLTKYSENSSGPSIYINPNFKRQQIVPIDMIPRTTHINPLFLSKTKEIKAKPPNIHMNPAFFIRRLQQLSALDVNPQLLPKAVDGNMPKNADKAVDHNMPKIADKGKIICNSKNRLIREPLHKKPDAAPNKPVAVPLKQAPLLVLNKRKLIRKTFSSAKTIELSKTKSPSRVTKYKVDNRFSATSPSQLRASRTRRISFVGRYSLRRSNSLISKKSNIMIRKPLPARTLNKNLKFLNINGLMYKSTRNSLKLNCQNSIAKGPISATKSSVIADNGLTIFVRGTKYVMDSKKFKLTRVIPSTSSSGSLTKAQTVPYPRRIDIGGFTYVSASTGNNVFIRTASYISRAHVYSAKQKSLDLLTKRLVKSNIPCPIFQRIGKCAAFERGKCSKVHHKLNVAICQKFLRGECINTKCLLSHNVSLSKMPVCKFFLQAVCVRNDCPYLHKKLGDSAEICKDFLKGYCKLADKCNQRHEFACPEYERTGICSLKNCKYCKCKKQKTKVAEEPIKGAVIRDKSSLNKIEDSFRPTQTETAEGSMRYFVHARKTVNESTTQNDVSREAKENDGLTNEEGNIVRVHRSKLADTLPAFIPL